MTGDPLVPRQCTAKSKRSGERCRRTAMKGSTVCPMHGGKSPGALAKAAENLATIEAEKAARTFGLPVEVNPHDALLQELHRTAGAVQWLGALVGGLDRDDIAWGKVKETRGQQLERGAENGTTWTSAPHAYVQLWQTERKHLVDVSKACITAGIEERRVRLAESAGQQLASVVRAVLDRLELSDAQRSLALVAVPEEFRRLGESVPGEVVA